MCHHGPGPGGPPAVPPPPPPQSMLAGGVGGGGHLGSHIGIGGGGIGHCGVGGAGPPPPPSVPPPPPLCNPCSSNSFNSVPMPGPSSSRWGPRTSCPVHSPFRVRVPNGSICSGHQVNTNIH